MSTPNLDALKAELDAGRMRVGNQVQLATGAPAASSVKQISIDASSLLQALFPVTAQQPDQTLEIFDLTGIAATGALTQTLVGAATVTTATIGGYVRIKITNSGTGFTTGNYYLPVYTIV